MKTYSIGSEKISYIKYDEVRQDLYIYFSDDTYGVYRLVPKTKVELFLDVPNSDGFYTNNFKNKFHEIILPCTHTEK